MELIAIKSCLRDVPKNIIQWEQWGHRAFSDKDIKFFYGDAGYEVEGGIILPGVGDDYMSLSYKTQAIVNWALERNYTALHIVDSDVYLRPEFIKCLGDYTGCKSPYSANAWGMCYSLTQKCMELIATAPVTDKMEDVWVGKVLFGAGIELTQDPNRHWIMRVGGHIGRDWSVLTKDFVSVGELDAREMQEFHQHVIHGTYLSIPSGPRRMRGPASAMPEAPRPRKGHFKEE